NILLAHIPHYQSFKSFNSDLIFCGDTHGGMIRLPKIGAVYYDGMFFPKQYTNELITDKGLFEFENTKLFVTSGLGGYPVLFRLNNRPEICSITLKGE
ncbi:MAG: metallophosphoesterase, partial [Ruminococcus sp.]|nr:metallophosphoesterase [Candidatus Copronaster equi]